MANLAGLSPEQINATVKTDLAQQNSLFNAASALANIRSKQPQAPDLVGVRLDGKEYKVRRQDLPETLEVMRKTNRDKDFEVFHLPGGAELPVRREDVPAFLQALYAGQRVPSQNQADRALAGLRGEQEEKAAAEADLIDQNINVAQGKARAIDALGGVAPEDAMSADNFSNLVQASPGTANALINKIQIGEKPLTISELNKVQESMGEIADMKDKYITDTHITNYNRLAEASKGISVMSRDEKGKPFTIELPVRNGQQITIPMVREAAKRNNKTFAKMINLIKLNLETE